MLDWLIIGGGLHGVHVAVRLLGETMISNSELAIVDPHDALLAAWRRNTSRTGMRHLRSPGVHHLALEPSALKRYVRRVARHDQHAFAPPYDRPSLALFDAHCDELVSQYGLGSRHVRARATRCVLQDDHAEVWLSTGERLMARQVVLALGMSEQPSWPEWAPRDDPRVRHLFDPAEGVLPEQSSRVAVVGGGISACQVALKLVASGHDVSLVTRHEMRCHQFDSDPGWLGPKYMRRFDVERDHCERRAMIRHARHRGSAPKALVARLDSLVARGDLAYIEDDVISLRCGDELVLRLAGERTERVDRVVLATGFEACRPGGALVDELADLYGLPCSSCTYPIVDRSLRWHPRVFVTGPLAELELGPVARNIAGARRAAERIALVARHGQLALGA